MILGYYVTWIGSLCSLLCMSSHSGFWPLISSIPLQMKQSHINPRRGIKKKSMHHILHGLKKYYYKYCKRTWAGLHSCLFTLEEHRTLIKVQSKCQLNVKCSKEIHDAADTAVQPPLLRADRTTNCVVWFSMKQHQCPLCHCWITLGSHYLTCLAFHSSEISCPTSCWLKLVRPCKLWDHAQISASPNTCKHSLD